MPRPNVGVPLLRTSSGAGLPGDADMVVSADEIRDIVERVSRQLDVASSPGSSASSVTSSSSASSPSLANINDKCPLGRSGKKYWDRMSHQLFTSSAVGYAMQSLESSRLPAWKDLLTKLQRIYDAKGELGRVLLLSEKLAAAGKEIVRSAQKLWDESLVPMNPRHSNPEYYRRFHGKEMERAILASFPKDCSIEGEAERLEGDDKDSQKLLEGVAQISDHANQIAQLVPVLDCPHESLLGRNPELVASWAAHVDFVKQGLALTSQISWQMYQTAMDGPGKNGGYVATCIVSSTYHKSLGLVQEKLLQLDQAYPPGWLLKQPSAAAVQQDKHHEDTIQQEDQFVAAGGGWTGKTELQLILGEEEETTDEDSPEKGTVPAEASLLVCPGGLGAVSSHGSVVITAGAASKSVPPSCDPEDCVVPGMPDSFVVPPPPSLRAFLDKNRQGTKGDPRKTRWSKPSGSH